MKWKNLRRGASYVKLYELDNDLSEFQKKKKIIFLGKHYYRKILQSQMGYKELEITQVEIRFCCQKQKKTQTSP